MLKWKIQSPKPLSLLEGYSLAILSVGAAAGIALLMVRLQFNGMQVPLFLFAPSITSWYAGIGPSVVALVLCCLSFDYFFVEPLYNLNISGADLPYFISFAAFALLVSWFASVRSRVEHELLRSRDELMQEVAERKQREEEIRTLNEELAKRSTDLEASKKE